MLAPPRLLVAGEVSLGQATAFGDWPDAASRLRCVVRAGPLQETSGPLIGRDTLYLLVSIKTDGRVTPFVENPNHVRCLTMVPRVFSDEPERN